MHDMQKVVVAPVRFTHHFLLHSCTTILEPGTGYLLG